ncbi:MAG: hypothetical protein AAGN35_02955 [Bacteroidota bacterium]
MDTREERMPGRKPPAFSLVNSDIQSDGPSMLDPEEEVLDTTGPMQRKVNEDDPDDPGDDADPTQLVAINQSAPPPAEDPGEEDGKGDGCERGVGEITPGLAGVGGPGMENPQSRGIGQKINPAGPGPRGRGPINPPARTSKGRPAGLNQRVARAAGGGGLKSKINLNSAKSAHGYGGNVLKQYREFGQFRQGMNNGLTGKATEARDKQPKFEVANQQRPPVVAKMNDAPPAKLSGGTVAKSPGNAQRLPNLNNTQDLGTAPTVQLQGDTDPNQIGNQEAVQRGQVQNHLSVAQQNSAVNMGEDHIIAETQGKLIQSKTEIPTPAPLVGKDIPFHEPPAEIAGSIGPQLDAEYQAKTDAELKKKEQADAEYDSEVSTGFQDTQNQISVAETDSNQQQQARKLQAQGEVGGLRRQWQAENDAVMSKYQDQAGKKKLETEGAVGRKASAADSEVAGLYRKADQDIASEEKKADADIAREKEEGEKEKKKKKKKRRFGSRLKKFFKGIGDKIKNAISKIADALRKVVDKIVSIAKAAAKKVIEAAASAIKVIIRAAGEALKAIASVALAAFPALRDKFNALIDRAVKLACEAVDKIAAVLEQVVNKLLDGLGALIKLAITVLEKYYQFIIEALEMIFELIMKLLMGLKNLVLSVGKMPGYFMGAAAKEAIGTDVTQPLDGIERTPAEQAKYEKMRQGDRNAVNGVAQASQGIEPEAQTLAGKDVLRFGDVELAGGPEVFEGLDLGDFGDEDGEIMELGGAEEPITTADLRQIGFAGAEGKMDSEAGGPEMEAEAAPNPDFASMSDDAKLDYYLKQMGGDSSKMETGAEGGEMAADLAGGEGGLESLQAKTGPLSVAQRLGFVVQQMARGIGVWFKENQMKVYGALIGALAGAGIITMLAGPAGLMAVIKLLLGVMTAYFGAEAVIRIEQHMFRWGKEAWNGNIESGAENLAIALAIFVMEFALEFILGVVMKMIDRAKAIVKSALRAAKKGMKTVSKAAKGIGKGLGKVGNVIVKNGKYMVNGFKKGWSKGVSTVGELKDKVLKRFGFKRIWIETKGQWIELWGSFNTKVNLGKMKKPTTKKASVGKVSKPKITKPKKKGKTVGDTRKEFTTNKVDPKTGKRVRHNGDAEFLAKERFLSKLDEGQTYTVKGKSKKFDPENMTWREAREMVEEVNGIKYAEYKGKLADNTLREAQHLIPASLGMKYDLDDALINSAENGMMLRSGRKGSEGLTDGYKSYKAKQTGGSAKTYQDPKVVHVGKNNRTAHPQYNDLVDQKLDAIKKAKGSVSDADARKVIDELRDLHRTPKKGAKYADDL